jgi:hypothetical protein
MVAEYNGYCGIGTNICGPPWQVDGLACSNINDFKGMATL